MPRPAITDMKVVFRVDSQLHAWFKAYCQQKGTTMSEMYRAWMLSLKCEVERSEDSRSKTGVERKSLAKRERATRDDIPCSSDPIGQRGEAES